MAEDILHYPSLDGQRLTCPSRASHHLVRLPSREELLSDAALDPIVSIVTPYYNDAGEIGETARSVLSQTIRNLEWVIVDDGSTEPDSRQALEAVAARDPRVRIERQENAGPARARNRGVEMARADLILFNDSDDLLEPMFAEKLLMALETFPGADWAYSGAIIFGTDNFPWMTEFEPRLFFERNICPMTSLVRKQAHLDAGGFDEDYRGHEDWDYWLRHVAAGHKGVLVREYLEHIRYSEGSRRRENNALDPGFESARERLREKYLARCEALPDWQRGERHMYPIDCPERFFDPFLSTEKVRIGRRGSGENVLILTNHFACGGADRFTLRMMEYLRREGAELTVAMSASGDNDWIDRAYAMSADMAILPETVRSTRWLDAVAWLIESRGVTRLVVTQSVWGYHAAPLLADRFPDIPFFDYSHCVETHWLQGGYPRLAAIMAPVWSRSYASSEHLRDWMIENCRADPDKMAVVRTGIDMQGEFNPERYDREAIRREMDLPDDLPVILHVSRMSMQKRPEVLVKIAAALREKRERFLVVALGAQPQALEHVRGLVDEAGLGEFFRLLAPDRRIARYLAACDCFLLPSLYEGLALTIPEALGMGAPVVASDVGGQIELMRDDVGWVVPLADPEKGLLGEGELRAYVDAVEEALEGGRDHPRAGANARRRAVEMFDLENCLAPFARDLLDPAWRDEGALAWRPQAMARALPHMANAYLDVMIASEHDHLTYDWNYMQGLVRELWDDHTRLGNDWEDKAARLQELGQDWEDKVARLAELGRDWKRKEAEIHALRARLHELQRFEPLLRFLRRAKRAMIFPLRILRGGGRK